MNPISEAIQKAKSKTAFAAVCGVSRPAIDKWEKKGRLPRTEWTGETTYAEKIFNEYGVVVPPFYPPIERQKTA